MVASGHRETLPLSREYFISQRFRIRADDLSKTIQPGPFSKSQDRQLQAAVLISNCLGKAWFSLNRRTIGDSLRQSATVCDLIFHFPAETCFHRSATVCDCLRLSATMILFKLKKSIFNFDLTPNQRAGIRYPLIG